MFSMSWCSLTVISTGSPAYPRHEFGQLISVLPHCLGPAPVRKCKAEQRIPICSTQRNTDSVNKIVTAGSAPWDLFYLPSLKAWIRCLNSAHYLLYRTGRCTQLLVCHCSSGRNFTRVLTISLFQNSPFAHRSPFPHGNCLSPGDRPQGKRMHEWNPVVAGEGCALMAGLRKCSPDRRPNNALATTELLPKAEEWGAEVWGKGITLNPLQAFHCWELWRLNDECCMHSRSQALPITNSKRSQKSASNRICPEA